MSLLRVVLVSYALFQIFLPHSTEETVEDTVEDNVEDTVVDIALNALRRETLERKETINSLMEEVHSRLILIELLTMHEKIDYILSGDVGELVKRGDGIEKLLGERMDSIKASLDEKMESIKISLDERMGNIKQSLDKRVDNIKTSLDETVSSINASLVDGLELHILKGIGDLKSSVSDEVEGMGSMINRTISHEVNRVNQVVSDSNSELGEDIIAGCRAAAAENSAESSEILQTVQDMGSRFGLGLEGVEEKISQVGSVIDLSRSEVRLISQQKLTWHNSTHGYNPIFAPDYAVDGVYNVDPNYLTGSNPFQHIGSNHINNMLIVDLGALFEIHTI